ncbi:MAG: glycosyltransferase family 4 protein [Crocinitomicaceae bacterium]
MSLKKVLIVTYYWPPSGGSGVQRWLKFTKYLREFGYEPVIYTVKDPNYALEDIKLIDDIPEGVKVLRRKIWEPNNLFSFFKKTKKKSAGFLDKEPSFLGKIMIYIRANYFIPDARSFWIKPSVKFLEKAIQDEDISLLITTGPPHSLNVIGLKLKEKTNIPWIADFRDPWTEIDYFDALPLTKNSLDKHHNLEKSVVSTADKILVIGNQMKLNFEKFTKNIKVIPNGFDTLETNSLDSKLSDKFSIVHIGLMNSDRNPTMLWEVIQELSIENENFKKDYKVELIGVVAKEVHEQLDKYNIENVELISYVPHDEVRAYQRNAQLLLLSVNNVKSAKGIITGKIFEYLQAKRPILAIGPTDGDLSDILNETNSGEIVNFGDKVKLKDVILNYYESYQKGQLNVNSTNIEKYHRKELTKLLASEITAVLNKKK